MKKGKTLLLALASAALITSIIYDKKNNKENNEQENLDEDKENIKDLNF